MASGPSEPRQGAGPEGVEQHSDASVDSEIRVLHSCDSSNPFWVDLSEFDSERACFLPSTGICFEQDGDGPTGYGDIVCLAAPAGRIRAAHVPYGVELPSNWHASSGHTLVNTLTEAEQTACDAMWAAAASATTIYPDGGVPRMRFGLGATLGPACE